MLYLIREIVCASCTNRTCIFVQIVEIDFGKLTFGDLCGIM